jgi:hypothetical protein
MSSTVQISLDNIREQQLQEIMERCPELPRVPSEALKVFLFNAMEKTRGVKRS